VLLWELWCSVSLNALGLVIFALSFSILFFTKTKVAEANQRDGFEYVIWGIWSLATLIIVSAPGLINLDWLKIWLAPKVYLIEYAANLM
jgi:hypothetical protein